MKTLAIITIIDFDNYGNRLQNYALSKYCENKFKVNTVTLLNDSYSNDKNYFFIRIIKNILVKRKYNKIRNTNRYNNFMEFNNKINFSKKKITAFSNLNKYDYIVVGSDQVWNPNFRRLRDVDLIKNASNSKKISYAASFGVEMIPEKSLKKLKKEINNFKSVSVREESAKKIIEKVSNRNDVDVLIDPTMLLTANEWDQVSKKPKMLKAKKFILNYFLGKLSSKRKNAIEKFAEENNCEIINLLDPDSPFYECGPSEFLYLEKNAFLICTDSFHSSVFAILYNRPFVIFEREEKGMANMSSRLNTLINKFNLKNRNYNGKNISNENLNHDYTEAYKILDTERKKSERFLNIALNIKDSD